MKKGWFTHGKWPNWMVRLHYYTIISFILLMLSGLALFLPAVHTELIPYLPFIYQMHIALGVIFAVSLLTPLLTRLPFGKLIRRLDWLFPLAFGTGIVITGVLLWQVTLFPTTWRSLAFKWHGWLSYTLLAWLLIHAAYKAISYRPYEEGLNAKIVPSRRRFLKWIGLSAVGTAVVIIANPLELLRGSIYSKVSDQSTLGTASDFAAFYTVINDYPTEDLYKYRLTVDGMVAQPTTLAWHQILALETRQELTNFHCVTGWSVANVKWKGIHLRSILHLVHPSPKARFVHFYSFDGVYTESLSLAEALDPTVMLAYELDGQPLSTQQGFPIRLVVPKMYGYKSIKWVTRVEFSDQPLVGYWEARGYPNNAYIGRGI